MNVSPSASGGPLKAIVRKWDRFWFSPADPTPLGVIRIMCGLFVFYVHLAYSVDLQEFFGKHAWVDAQAMEEHRKEFPFPGRTSSWDETRHWSPFATKEEEDYARRWFGVNPRDVVAKGLPVWSVWFHVTDPTLMVVVHVAVLVILLLFTIGFCTRITSVLAWLGVVSYIQRAPTTLFGMDTMMNILMIYLMIGPSGAALSVDRLIARYWAARRALRVGRAADTGLAPVPTVSANLAIRLLQVHLCIIYLAAGLSKRGATWWNGLAPWGTMANPAMSPLHVGFYLETLNFLVRNRWLFELVMSGLAIFTLTIEIGFAFTIWNRRLRWLMLTMAVLMHTGIAVFMGLNTFGLMMICMLMAFVPLDTIRGLLRLLGRGSPPVRLEFDSRVPRQLRSASLVRAFDAWDQVEIADQSADANGSRQRLRLITEAGEVSTGFKAFEHIVRSMRLLWPLYPGAKLLEMTGLGNRWFPGGSEPATAQLHHSGNGQPVAAGEKLTR
jgi:hypothetical protein